ncbi:hypothetical protein GCM10027594_35430 [Hymenobacter agri]
MLRKLLLYAALLTLTQCSTCKRDNPQPQPPKDPLSTRSPETQTGAGTFAYLINGKAFIALYTTSANGDWQSLNRLAIRRNNEVKWGCRCTSGEHLSSLKWTTTKQPKIFYYFFSLSQYLLLE